MNAQEGRGPGKRVLIVDDSVDTARMMMVLLKYEGHDVRTAHDGREALKMAGDFHPDIVLLDLIMPGMSGREVAAALRQDQAFSRTRILAISGYDEEGTPPGFDHLMVKPVDHGALLRWIAAPPGTSADSRIMSGEPHIIV